MKQWRTRFECRHTNTKDLLISGPLQAHHIESNISSIKKKISPNAKPNALPFARLQNHPGRHNLRHQHARWLLMRKTPLQNNPLLESPHRLASRLNPLRDTQVQNPRLRRFEAPIGILSIPQVPRGRLPQSTVSRLWILSWMGILFRARMSCRWLYECNGGKDRQKTRT